jgi:hypothetical protein
MKNNENNFLAWHVLKRCWLVEMQAVLPKPQRTKGVSQMKQNAQIRTQLLTVIMAGVGFATAATAAEVDASVDAKVGADAQVAAPGNIQAGGTADAHMSPSGSTNSNAQWQSGATRGADRAGERMSMSGSELKPSTELGAAGKTTAKAKRSVTR